MRRWTLVALVIALLFAACDDDAKDNASGENAASADASAETSAEIPGAVGDDGGSDDSSSDDDGGKDDDDAGFGRDEPKASSGGSGTTTTTVDLKALGIDVKQFEGDWVAGSPKGRSQDDPRPNNCTFKVGEMCRMQITGNYQLKTKPVASIHVGAYEDGATEPSFHTTLPNARQGASPWYVDKFPYQARAGVEKVDILVKMLDATGKELARGKPTTFPIEG